MGVCGALAIIRWYAALSLFDCGVWPPRNEGGTREVVFRRGCRDPFGVENDDVISGAGASEGPVGPLLTGAEDDGKWKPVA